MVILVSSDFSFAERAVIDVWIWLWFIQRVWSTDKFACLQWSKIRNFDLKSIITVLIFLMLPVQATFDISWTYLKYNEGYIVDPVTYKVYTKPTFGEKIGNKRKHLWSEEDILIKTITEYILALDFAFQIGTLALMQAFWSHLSSQMGGKPFMRTTTFRFYVGWLFASIIIFPLARVLTSRNVILIENVPQLIFAIQLFIIFLLGIRNGKELNNLLNSIRQSSSQSGQETVLRICYFIEMNKLVMFGTLLTSIGMSILTIGSIFFDQIIQSKFLLDLLLIHANFGSLILWVTMILIVYPRYYITGTAGVMINNYSNHSNFNVPKDKSLISPQQSYVINLTTTTTVSSTQPLRAGGSQINKNIEKSINSLLEEQKYHFEIFKHKTSASISSTTTLASSQPSSPSIPPPPLFPPPPIPRKNSFTV